MDILDNITNQDWRCSKNNLVPSKVLLLVFVLKLNGCPCNFFISITNQNDLKEQDYLSSPVSMWPCSLEKISITLFGEHILSNIHLKENALILLYHKIYIVFTHPIIF